MAKYSILGASGFIGGHLTDHLRDQGEDVLTPDPRDGKPVGDAGNIIYCIGVTADFRNRPIETMRAHVCVLADVLEHWQFSSLLYLSSTRVYGGGESGAEEAKLRVAPSSPSDLYNLSKLAGESLCLSRDDPSVRIARLANVFADDARVLSASADFLPSLLRAALDDGIIHLETAPDSTKDYVWIGDVVRALHRISESGGHRLYNVASGHNTSHGDILGALQRLTGCEIDVSPGAPRTIYPSIDVTRLGTEFAPPDRPWAPVSLIDEIEKLVAAMGTPAPAGVLA